MVEIDDRWGKLRKKYVKTPELKTEVKAEVKAEPEAITQLENTKKVTEQIPSFLESTQNILHQAPSLMGLDVGSIFEGITNGVKGAIDTYSRSTESISKGNITGGLLGYGWGTGQGMMGLLSATPQLGAFTTAMDKVRKSGLVSDNTMQAVMSPLSTLLKEAEKDPELMYQIIANAPPQIREIISSPMGRESLAGVTDVALQGAIFHGLTKGVKKFGGQEVKLEVRPEIKSEIRTETKPEVKTEPIIRNVDKVQGKPKQNIETKVDLPEQKPVELVPKQEVPVVEGKPTKVAKDINTQLVEKGFDELPPEELANYNPITKKVTIQKATDLLEKDYNKAKDIATGKETSKDISPSDEQVIFNAVKNKAIDENNPQVLKELALSPIAKRRSEAAQTLGASGFNNGNTIDPVKAIQDVVKTREESPAGKRREIITKEYDTKIKSLEDKLTQQEERIRQIETEKSYKKIQREESFRQRKEKRQVTTEVLDREFNDIISEFVKSYKPNVMIDPKQVQILVKAVKNKAQKGITNAEQVVDEIYMALADKIEGITKRDIRDAISGYGKSTERTRDELQVSVADLKKQMELASKIEDIELGKTPFKKEINKNEPSAELQTLKDELKTKLKESDIVEQENLGKTKEQIQKRIDEINNKILTGDYVKKEKTISPTDLEKEKLQKELKATRDKFNDIQKNLGDKISDEEVKIISDLSKKTNDAKTKMDNAPQRELGKPQTKEELEYGNAYTDYSEYVDALKENANKMTWQEFKQSPLANLIKGAGHIPGMTKSLKATFDNSGLFNQNIRVLLTHPSIWAKNGLKSFQDIWNTIGGKNVMKMVNSDKVSRPNYRNGKYQKEKLAIGTVEETFPDSKLLEKIPIAGRIHKAANTAFTAMAYRNRMDLFDLLVKHAENMGADYTGIGKIVNSLTGRGSLGKFEGGADILNATMFSPRLLKSHIDVLTAHAFSKDLSPFARKEAIKNLVKIVGGISATTTAINAIKPGTIEIDPRSTDFVRVKIGDTRFNYTGGLGSVITLASRIAPSLVGQTAYTKNAKGELVALNSGKYGSRTSLDVLTDFMQGKSSPVLGMALSKLEGQTFSGDRLTTGNQLTNVAMPLPIQNAIETKQNPKSANLVLTAIADAVGLFATTYSNDPELRKVKNTLLRADKEKMTGKQKLSYNQSLLRALKNKSITLDQYKEFRQQLLELQKDAPNKEIK